MARPQAGVFIVFEGPDKSGKSTQAALLARRLRARGVAFLHTREPGGTSFAEAIRRILLEPRRKVEPLAELLLYEAARAQHTLEKIRPALSRGRVVVSERYTMATLAYQGYGRGLPLASVRALNRIATQGLRPDLTILIDVPEAAFSARGRGRRLDRLERENSRFRRRVREGYRALAAGERAVVLDGRRPVEDVHQKILRLVEPFLRIKPRLEKK